MTDKEIIRDYIKNESVWHKIIYWVGLVKYKVCRSRIDYSIKKKANVWNPLLYIFIVLAAAAYVVIGIVYIIEEYINELDDMFKWS